MDGTPPTKESQDEKGDSLINLVSKTETKKAVVAFENILNKTVLEEKRSGRKGEKKVKGSEEKTERPTSADVSGSKCLLEKCTKKRPQSSEALCGEGEGPWGGPEGPWSRRGSSLGSEGEPWAPPPRPRSLIHHCPHSDAFPGFRLRRKCKSSCHFSHCEKMPSTERDFHKVQRSLRLLGFEASDFGILSCRAETTPKGKPQRPAPTLSTKVTRRSVSLDSLRTAVRRAWLDDRLDDSHRRLLAQAAYEEWYFTKERELREKREEDRIKQLNAKLKLRADFQRKKEKSEEEFQKWLKRKTKKRKGQETIFLQKHQNPSSRLTITKEKSEKAFLNWKKNKDKEIEKRKMEKRKEEEKSQEKEKQKAERKIIAEKAFQQWKLKLEENERKNEAKKEKNKRQKEIEIRRRRAEGSQISFLSWKKAKDEEIKQKIKQYREYDKATREERCAQMEERMYEAEQAFEDWLEQVDLRRRKHSYSINYQKNIPWIPV